MKFILGILASLIYVQVRLILAFVLWQGIPAINVWVSEHEMVQRHTVAVLLLDLHILLFCFLPFWWVMALLGVQFLTVLIYTLWKRQIK